MDGYVKGSWGHNQANGDYVNYRFVFKVLSSFLSELSLYYSMFEISPLSISLIPWSFSHSKYNSISRLHKSNIAQSSWCSISDLYLLLLHTQCLLLVSSTKPPCQEGARSWKSWNLPSNQNTWWLSSSRSRRWRWWCTYCIYCLYNVIDDGSETFGRMCLEQWRLLPVLPVTKMWGSSLTRICLQSFVGATFSVTGVEQQIWQREEDPIFRAHTCMPEIHKVVTTSVKQFLK